MATSAPVDYERYGLFKVQDPPNAAVDIVAVHGLFGDWRTTWTLNTGNLSWLENSDFWADDDLSRARVFAHGYDHQGAFGQAVSNIHSAAQFLLVNLRGMRRRDRTSRRPLIFLAHSVGGIIVKEAINLAFSNPVHYGDINDSTRGIIFLATPHTGAAIRELGQRVGSLWQQLAAGLVWSPDMTDALASNSPGLHSISEQFTNRTSRLQIRSFYETERYREVWIVDQDSACLHVPTEEISPYFGANHINISKFAKPDSGKFSLLYYALSDLIEVCVSSDVGESTVAGAAAPPPPQALSPSPRPATHTPSPRGGSREPAGHSALLAGGQPSTNSTNHYRDVNTSGGISFAGNTIFHSTIHQPSPSPLPPPQPVQPASTPPRTTMEEAFGILGAGMAPRRADPTPQPRDLPVQSPRDAPRHSPNQRAHPPSGAPTTTLKDLDPQQLEDLRALGITEAQLRENADFLNSYLR